MAATPTLNLGFLTVLHESNSYLGGYLVANTWGRPLEFRLSSAVQPNRVQQILYASTLQPYICADLIGKTLVDKAGVGVQLVLTDTEVVLELRHKLEVPVVWVSPAGTTGPGEQVVPATATRGPVLIHPRYASDIPAVQEMLATVDGLIDLAEPFVRIREAISEARKMGVTSKAG